MTKKITTMLIIFLKKKKPAALFYNAFPQSLFPAYEIFHRQNQG